MPDVFFISHGESNADENWERLQDLCPDARRVDGVDGLFEAHRACAELSTSDNFFVVDADAWVFDSFDFKFMPDPDKTHWHVSEKDCVLVWPARNPVNGLEYGYGGIKMLPRAPFLENREWNLDMTTTIGSVSVDMPGTGCETRFNATPESAWIGAFREAAKLSSLHTVIVRARRQEAFKQLAFSTLERFLEKQDWTDREKENHRQYTKINIGSRYDKSSTVNGYWDEIERATQRCAQWTRLGWFEHNGSHAVKGARRGQQYGLMNAGDDRAMALINDWTWLKSQFEKAQDE